MYSVDKIKRGAFSALCGSVPHRLPYFFLTRSSLVHFATATRVKSRNDHFAQFSPIMSEEQVPSASEAAQRQVRVQLTSQQEDIALPESTGPILVPTSKNLFYSYI